MTACPHPGCPGTVTPAGFCRVSGERVDRVARRHASVVPVLAAGPRPAVDIDVQLPEEGPDPTLLPVIRRRGEAVSGGTADELSGKLLGDQYLTAGRLGEGGVGAVYLALDRKVDDREVVVKFLRPDQAAAYTAHVMEDERRAFGEINHDGIIPVFNSGQHEELGHYLVLPYIDGLDLEEVRKHARARPELFGGPRFHEFALAYGVRILSALAYLHAPERRKVYGDLKPQNVMHDGAITKIIDVGSIRDEFAPGHTTDDFRAPSVPESTGESGNRDDLFSLGESLRRICGLGSERSDLPAIAALDRLAPPDAASGTESRSEVASGAGPGGAADRSESVAARMTTPGPQGLGLVSLARVLYRATRDDPADRFATAQEMDGQLRGVFRELRSLRTGLETFEPSPLFWQSAHALDGALGVGPELSQWSVPAAAGEPAAPLHTPPSAGDVAVGLPVPRPDPDDAQFLELSRLVDADPGALLQRTRGWGNSPEVHLLRCRLRLRVAVGSGAGAGPGAAGAAEGGRGGEDLAEARREVARAAAAIGSDRARHDWRIDWHRGLLALAEGEVRPARKHFDTVYAAIPGEYPPKLALGCCAEKLRRWPEALTFHEAVRLRNPSLGAAAFGVARARLAQGDPGGALLAVQALDAVPQHSRHHTAARTAAVRIGIGQAADARQLTAVLSRLAHLFHGQGLIDEEVGVRLKAEVWEATQDLLARGLVGARELREAAAHRDAELIGFPADEHHLRTDLSRFYVLLARQAALTTAPDGAELAERLLDRAYQVRPFAFRHNRESLWFAKKVNNWLRAATAAPGRWTPPSASK